MTAPIPFAPGAVRAFLIAQPRFTDLVPVEAITTRDLPDPITGPFVTLRAPGNVGVDPLLRRPLVQVDAWAPRIERLGGSVDPEELTWNISALAGQLLGRARSQEFRGSAWTAGWTDGPITSVDKTRGADQLLFRATVRVELKMRAPRT
ncbi:hypothetical protein GV794_01920 [Nocardia cyriacigeorgica]|uniref:Tail terminator n=1 Tax=Nocardia cyriacigeorgica TaxID=135487 RepID=A0ABX0CFJ5_9NOCA|nr:hypothetical protein [Nocardia cyriacigeorgica]NEW40780.1 hypothetical protein [Nocardia cyriacigeorgica]NEW50994.1 hypothetical protein [Nocardia cyriacigeorgica]NEW54423.1 hypothetical protein [Nocardia cyriacigeorgica]